LSGYGKIKLGADHDEPEFSYLSWAGMLFAAGISITLFFFCVSEPLTHMLQPPQGEAARRGRAPGDADPVPALGPAWLGRVRLRRHGAGLFRLPA
jgi:choline-glycine betaine transporter